MQMLMCHNKTFRFRPKAFNQAQAPLEKRCANESKQVSREFVTSHSISSKSVGDQRATKTRLKASKVQIS